MVHSVWPRLPAMMLPMVPSECTVRLMSMTIDEGCCVR